MKRFNWKLLTKHSKVVKIFTIVLCGVLLCTSLSFLVMGIVRRVEVYQKGNSTIEETVVTYSEITYRAVENGVVVYVYEDFYSREGYYPERYKDGEKVHIDDLETFIWIGLYEDRMFQGWYLDSACTIPYENDVARTGNFIVYAKLQVGHWTPLV